MFQDDLDSYDYNSIDYWPNEGSDYMEIHHEEEGRQDSRGERDQAVIHLKANWVAIVITELMYALVIGFIL